MAKKKSIESTIKSTPNLLKWWKSTYIWVCLVFILAITFTTFYPSLYGQFIRTWDDYGYAVNNPYINDLNWESVKGMFTNPLHGNYNPLTILTFAIEKHLFGTNPFVHHFNNILLHLINITLVFWLAIRLRLRLIAALLVSTLFAIHPMHVESVAWITERKDVLFAAFYLGALISYIYYFKRKQPRYYLLCIFLAILALFSKIQAVSLPLSMLMIDFYFRRKLHWRLIAEKIPFFCLSLLFGLLGVSFLKTAGAFNISSSIEWYERPIMGTYALGAYLYKALIPYPLSAYYPYPSKIDGWFPMVYYIVPILTSLVAIAALFTYKRTRIVLFGLGFFFFNIVFLLQVVEAGAGFIADRFSYISYIGLFFIFAQGFTYLFYQKPKWKIPLLAILTVYLIFLGAYSFDRTKAWLNDATLWTAALQQYPNISFAYTGRASYFAEKQQFPKAIADLDQFITLRPYNIKGYYERGLVYLQMKDYERAIRDFNDALKLQPQNHNVLNYKSMALMEAQKYSEAIDVYTQMLQTPKGKEDKNAYMQRAIAFEKLQNTQAAVNDYTKLLQLDSENVNALLHRGGIYFQLQQFEPALSDMNKVLNIQTQNSKALLNRAIIYASTNQHSSAISDFDAYLQLKPADAQAFNWRGVSKTKLGNYTAAIEDFSKAIQAKPIPHYYKNRADAYLKIGETAKAEEDLKRSK